MAVDLESRADISSSSRFDRNSRNSILESLGVTHSKMAFDRNFIRSASGLFLTGEMVFGLLMWTLIGGTDCSHVPLLWWAMFISIIHWVLTFIFFLSYLTRAQSRIPTVPWNILDISLNASGTLLYLCAVGIGVMSLHRAIRGRYYFNSWLASTIFASLAMLCYAASTVQNFKSWRSKSENS
ncbi:hypothetical protein DNTS_014916 [Danionella cerebrum]|uniref:MARVEL domain-containing protein n=1 Tax=Danionella cerebrum TaxID=2873325 RepID=A0A553MKQ1_9TELE|nr:hypothetical protein DNTS_014916 [Danionella translucida]